MYLPDPPPNAFLFFLLQVITTNIINMININSTVPLTVPATTGTSILPPIIKNIQHFSECMCMCCTC